MVRNLFGYPIILAITVYLGILNRQPWIILLFFAELILFLLQILSIVYQGLHLIFNIRMPQPTLLGNEQALIEVSMKNYGILPIQRLEIQTKYQFLTKRIRFIRTGKLRKNVKVWAKIDSEDTQGYEILSGPFPSGQFLISIPYIRIYDYFGVFSIKIRVKKTQVITVLPNFVTMPIILLGREISIDHEDGSTRKGQDPTEIYDIREYRAGDNLRQIYWKRSAGREVVLYRENAEQKGVVSVLFLQLPKNQMSILFHYELKIAGSFMFSLLQKGYLHFLVWENIEDDILERRLIKNEQDLYEVMTELLSTIIKKEKRKKKQKEKNTVLWQEYIKFRYQAQFQEESCPEAFFLLQNVPYRKKEVLILEQEMGQTVEFLKEKRFEGNRQEEQRLEEEMRGL